MRNLTDSEDERDYSPNELARLSIYNWSLYRQIVQSNLENGDTVEQWQKRNTENAKRYIDAQRYHMGQSGSNMMD